MSLIPVTPPAGVVANGTEYSNKGRWADSNLIRWVDKTARPIGGWSIMFDESIVGDIIGVYSYAIGQLKIIIVATTEKVYRYDGSINDITPDGFNPPVPGQLSDDGYGAGYYGQGDYGDPSETPFVEFLPTAYAYAFASFGTTLIMSCTSDNIIYKLADGDDKLTRCANSPKGVLWSLVSDERFVFAIGPKGNRGKIQWSDIENYEVWTSKATNRAGSLTIPDESNLTSAISWKGKIYLFSSSAVYIVSYVGGTLVYGIKKIVNQYDEPMSQRCVVATPNFLCWLNRNGVSVWDGQYRQVECDVHDYIKDNIAPGYEQFSFGGYNEAFNEVWWFFCSTAPTSGQPVCDKYVIWNITDNLWSVGELSRNAWDASSVYNRPLLASSDRKILGHEHGLLSDSDGIGESVPFMQSAPQEIGSGDNLLMIDRMIPDEKTVNPEVLIYSLTSAMYPSTAQSTTGDYTVVDGKIDLRLSARQIAVRVTGPTDSDWSIGTLRASVKPRGRR